MPYSISTRKLEPEEREALRASMRFSLMDSPCIVLPMLGWGILGLLFGLGIEWAVSITGADISPSMRYGNAIVFCIVGAVRGFKRYLSRTAAILSKFEDSVVKVIHIQDAPCIAQEGITRRALYFQIAPGKILLIESGWLHHLVECGPHDINSADVARADQRDSDHEFPCTEFKLYQSSCCRLFRIEAIGKALEPIRQLDFDLDDSDELPYPYFSFAPEFLVGTLDDLPGAMERREKIAELDF